MDSPVGKAQAAWRVMNTPIPNPIKYWFKHEFAPRMPRQWKRLLYIAGVIALTSFTDKPDFMLFEKINEMLKMSYKGQNYWVPKFVRDWVWSPILRERIDLEGKSVPVTQLDKVEVNSSELEQIVDFLLERTPDWIEYAPKWYMKKDLTTCLTQLFQKRYDTQLA